MESQSHGTSLSLHLIGVGQPRGPALTQTCWRTPQHTAVNSRENVHLWCVAGVWHSQLLCMCQILKLIREWLNWDGSQTNISTFFVTLGDSRARRLVRKKVIFKVRTCQKNKKHPIRFQSKSASSLFFIFFVLSSVSFSLFFQRSNQYFDNINQRNKHILCIIKQFERKRRIWCVNYIIFKRCFGTSRYHTVQFWFYLVLVHVLWHMHHGLRL